MSPSTVVILALSSLHGPLRGWGRGVSHTVHGCHPLLSVALCHSAATWLSGCEAPPWCAAGFSFTFNVWISGCCHYCCCQWLNSKGLESNTGSPPISPFFLPVSPCSPSTYPLPFISLLSYWFFPGNNHGERFCLSIFDFYRVWLRYHQAGHGI